MNVNHFKKSGATFLSDFNEIADDNAVGKHYTTNSGYQSSGVDIGNSLIEKTFTIEASTTTDSKYTSTQIIKDTGKASPSGFNKIQHAQTYLRGETITTISADGKNACGVTRYWGGDDATRLMFTKDYGATWSQPAESTHPQGLRGLAVSANGIIAIAGTAGKISTSSSNGNGGFHSMYYNANEDWCDSSKYTETDYTAVWSESTMNGGINLYRYQNSTYKTGFRHVVLSATGQYGACTFTLSYDAIMGNAYYTSDYGATWDLASSVVSPLVWWMSSSGQYCYGTWNGSLVHSSTYGETWQLDPNFTMCNRVTASADGQYVIHYTIPTTEPYVTSTIYRSDDYGMTWATVTNLAGNNLSISKISMSANGRYVVGESYTRLIRSSDYGATWIDDATTTFNSNKGYGSCSMSANGEYAINTTVNYSSSADKHYTYFQMFRNNSTATETKDLAHIYEPKLSYNSSGDKASGNFYSIGVSGNGNYVLYGSSVYDASIKLSSDRGNNWISVSGLNQYRLYGTVSISYDGKFIFTGISQNNKVCGLSTDYGTTWQIYDKSSDLMGDIVGMNSDGKYMYSGLYNYASGNGNRAIQRSDDYGASWSAVDGLKETNDEWINPTQIAVSATGQYGIVSGKGCDIYRTSDYGVSWDSCGIGDKYRMGATISKNGKYCVASEGSTLNNKESGIIHSSDFGVTWSPSTISSTNQWFFSMSMSDSGQYVVAINAHTQLYISNDFGVSFVNRSISGSLRECAMTGKGDIIWTASTTKIQKHTMV